MMYDSKLVEPAHRDKVSVAAYCVGLDDEFNF